MGRPRKDAAAAAKTHLNRLSRPPYAMPLDTIGNVRRELGRLYRASLSGKLESAEAARLAFILKEVRASLEVEAASKTFDLPVGSFGDIVVLSVPRGSIADTRTGLVTTPDGAPVSLEPLVPHRGTPPLELFLPDQSQSSAESLPVIEVPDDGKVTRLNPFRSRDDEGPAGAA